MAKTFHLGITMAGAVSAGAYTAGVIDYLFEALDRWEKEKKEATNHAIGIPDHQVRIDVMGGASAGGMSAAIAALACFTGLKPVTDFNIASREGHGEQSGNILFQSWVDLADEPELPTFHKMLSAGDLQGKGALSVLNTQVIDHIAARAGDKAQQYGHADHYPPFVAPDMELLLTLCSLRGIPIGIDFASDNKSKTRPTHQMENHKIFARFKLGIQKDTDKYFALAASEKDGQLINLDKLLQCAKATGAFPVALAARKINWFTKEYLRTQMSDLSSVSETYLDKIFHDTFPGTFDFVSIDGGTLNNEPFSEIEAIIKSRGIKDDAFAMILIDPFPNFSEKELEHYQHPESLENMLGPIMGTLRDQAMLKERDILQSYTEVDRKRNMIFPSRPVRTANKGFSRAKGNPIACGGMGGFSGFLDRRFRVHDYFLGRHNCRNFLRFYFNIRCPKSKDQKTWNPIFESWTPEMIQHYKIKEDDHFYWLPIIPVFEFMEKVEKRIKASSPEHKLDYAKASFLEANDTWNIEFPQMEAEKILALKPLLEHRLSNVLDKIMEHNEAPSSSEERRAEGVDAFHIYMKKEFSPSMIGKATSFLFGGVMEWVARRQIISRATDYSVKYMLKDLHASKLLKLPDEGD